MSSKTGPVPEQQSVTPNLAIRGAAEAIEFYEKVFGATVMMRLMEPSGKVGHAELRIGNSRIALADEYPDHDHLGPQSRGGSTVGLHLSVEDVDDVFNRAVAAGAKVLSPVKEEFFGERVGRLADPFGHVWYIATTTEKLSDGEIEKRYEDLINNNNVTATLTSPRKVIEPG